MRNSQPINSLAQLNHCLTIMENKALYLHHFGFKRLPFVLSPQPDFFYGGAKRDDGLRQLMYFAHHGEGVALVSGEVGMGKTMLLTMLVHACRTNSEQNSAMRIEPIVINRMMTSPTDIAHVLAEQMGIPVEKNDGLAHLGKVIEQKLIRHFAEGLRVIIIVDEAHAHPTEVLEWLRLLTNLETASGKLLQLIFFAQPEIMARLATSELRALADRMTLHVPLAHLSLEEIRSYIDHRLRLSGYRGDTLFTPQAVQKLAQESAGLTRRIHILCDKALLASYIDGDKTVELHHIERAVAEHNIRQATAGKPPQAFGAHGQSDFTPERPLIWASAPSAFWWQKNFPLSARSLPWLLAMLALIFALWVYFSPHIPTAIPHPQSPSHVPSVPSSSLQPLNPSPPPSIQPNALNSSQPQPAKISWHPGVNFDWSLAPPALQKMLDDSAVNWAQIYRDQPEGAFIRLVSLPIPQNPAQAQAFAQRMQDWVFDLANRQSNDVVLGQKPVAVIAYRFSEGGRDDFRIIVAGYAQINEAFSDTPLWLRHTRMSARGRFTLSVRPNASLLP